MSMFARRLLSILVLGAVASAIPTAYAAKNPLRSRKKGSADRVKSVRPPKLEFDPAAINNPPTLDPVVPGFSGSAAVRAQILLDRAHFSPGEIDGHYGENSKIAIIGYQAARRLPATGVIDAATWQSLNADLNPVLVPYAITQEDATGPYEQIPSGMMEQSQLKSLGFQYAGEALGERFHIEPKLLETLNAGKSFTTVGEQILVPNVTRQLGLVQADRITVSKSAKTVTALAADGTVLAQYPSTTGSEHDPLPIGEWKVTIIQHNPIFHYNPDLFWDAKDGDEKAKIPPGPNNPVGVAWIGLSKEHYGIHGTPQPGTVGHSESHGCIRVTNWDAAELAQMVKPGTRITLAE